RALPGVDRLGEHGHDGQPRVEAQIAADPAAGVADAALLQQDRSGHAARREDHDVGVEFGVTGLAVRQRLDDAPAHSADAAAVGDQLFDPHAGVDAGAGANGGRHIGDVDRFLGAVATAREALARAFAALDVAPGRLARDPQRLAALFEAQVALALDRLG